jgi:hypothetical protein
MFIRSIAANELTLVPNALRQLLLRVALQGEHSGIDRCPVRLDICDANLRVVSAVELPDSESLQLIQQQAARLGYRSVGLAGTKRDESPRLLLVPAPMRAASGAAPKAGRRRDPHLSAATFPHLVADESGVR